MDISEVEEILALYRVPKPQHIIVVTEPVSRHLDGVVYYRGLQPGERNDTIVLTSQAIDETVLHEVMHCLGFGEMGANFLGKVMVTKYRVLRNFPLLKSFLQREVKYQKCGGCQVFPKAHQYGDRVEHYVKLST
jgi:hypothetical protein